MPVKTSVFIRRAERDDLDTVVAWMEEPDFVRFLYGDPARSPKQIRERIVSMLGRSAVQAIPGGLYLVIDSVDYGPVGLLSLQNISWRNRACCLDLFVGHDKLRGHLASAVAFYCAMNYCFHELNLHRITAYIYSFNEASWQVLEKAGAVRELVLREHVARDGQIYDMYGYGLPREEYEAECAKHPRFVEGLMESMIEEQAKAQAARESENGS